MDVPTSAQAALVFLVIVLPGFLAQGGYRVGRAVPEHPQGLVAIARVIALSTLIALAAWKLGGKDVFDHARAATALTAYESETYRFALALFFIPPLVRYVAGQGVDAVARRVADALDRLPGFAFGSRRLEPSDSPQDPRDDLAASRKRGSNDVGSNLATTSPV